MGNNTKSISELAVAQPARPGEWVKQGTTGYCDIVRNVTSGVEAEQYFLQRDTRISLLDDFKRYQFRRTQFSNLVQVYHVQKQGSQYICQGGEYLRVKTQRISRRLSQMRNLTFPQTLYVLLQSLNGFKTINELHGPVTINDEMIGFSKGKVKVWLNENYARNLPDPEHDAMLVKRQGELRPESKFVNDIVDAVEDHTEGGHYPTEFRQRYEQVSPHTFGDAINFVKGYAQGHSIPIPSKLILGRSGSVEVPRNTASQSNSSTVVEHPPFTQTIHQSFSQPPKIPAAITNSPIRHATVQRFSDTLLPQYQQGQQFIVNPLPSTSLAPRKVASEGLSSVPSTPGIANMQLATTNRGVTFVQNDQRRVNPNFASQKVTATPIATGNVSRVNYFQAQTPINQQSFLRINQNQISRFKPLTAIQPLKSSLPNIFEQLRAPSLNKNALSKIQYTAPIASTTPVSQPQTITAGSSGQFLSVTKSIPSTHKAPTPLPHSNFPGTGIHVLNSYNQASRLNTFFSPPPSAPPASNKSNIIQQKPASRPSDRLSIGRVPTAPVTSSNQSTFNSGKPLMFRSGAASGSVNVNFKYSTTTTTVGAGSHNIQSSFFKGVNQSVTDQKRSLQPQIVKEEPKKQQPVQPASILQQIKPQPQPTPVKTFLQPQIKQTSYPGIPLTKVQQQIMLKRQNQQANIGVVRLPSGQVVDKRQLVQQSPKQEGAQQQQQQTTGLNQNSQEQIRTEPDVTPETLFEPRPNEMQRKQIKIIYESQQKDSMTLDNLAAAYRTAQQQPAPPIKSAFQQQPLQTHHEVKFEDRPVITKQKFFQPKVVFETIQIDRGQDRQIPTFQKKMAENIQQTQKTVANIVNITHEEGITYDQDGHEQHYEEVHVNKNGQEVQNEREISEQRPQQPESKAIYEKVRYQEQPLEYQKQYFQQLQLFQQRREAEEKLKLDELRKQQELIRAQEKAEAEAQARAYALAQAEAQAAEREYQEQYNAQVTTKVYQKNGHQVQQYTQTTEIVRDSPKKQQITYVRTPQNNIVRVVNEPEDEQINYETEQAMYEQQDGAIVHQTNEQVQYYDGQGTHVVHHKTIQTHQHPPEGHISQEAYHQLRELQEKMDFEPTSKEELVGETQYNVALPSNINPRPIEVEKEVEIIEENGKPIGYQVIETDVYYTPEGERITVQEDYQVIYDERTGAAKYIDVDSGQVRQAKPEELQQQMYAKQHLQQGLQSHPQPRIHYAESPSAMHYFPVQTVNYDEVVKPVNPMLVPRSYHSHVPSGLSQVPPNSFSGRLSAPRETSNKYTTEYGSSLKFSEEAMSSEGVVGELLEGSDGVVQADGGVPTYEGLRANIVQAYGNQETGSSDYFARIERVDSLPYQARNLSSQVRSKLS